MNISHTRLIPAPSRVSLSSGRLSSPTSSGTTSLPAVARPRGAQKPCPAPVPGGESEQQGVTSPCWPCAGALQVPGWECSGAAAKLARAAPTSLFLCPQCRDRADGYLHRHGFPPEDGKGRGEGGRLSLCAEAAGAAGQHGADQGEESHLLPARCQAADVLPTLPRDVVNRATVDTLCVVQPQALELPGDGRCGLLYSTRCPNLGRSHIPLRPSEVAAAAASTCTSSLAWKGSLIGNKHACVAFRMCPSGFRDVGLASSRLQCPGQGTMSSRSVQCCDPVEETVGWAGPSSYLHPATYQSSYIRRTSPLFFWASFELKSDLREH